MIRRIRAAVIDGDEAAIADIEQQGYGYAVDAANGVVHPKYALCAYQNGNGDCAYFEPKARPRP
jgi:hypothetical protein